MLNIKINLGFVVSSTSKDKNDIDNFKYRKWYFECIDLLIHYDKSAGCDLYTQLQSFIFGEDELFNIELTEFIITNLIEQVYKIKT